MCILWAILPRQNGAFIESTRVCKYRETQIESDREISEERRIYHTAALLNYKLVSVVTLLASHSALPVPLWYICVRVRELQRMIGYVVINSRRNHIYMGRGKVGLAM